jgi:hypothetical protein
MNVKIDERKILKAKKPNGSIQYLLTIPKHYADSLMERGIDTLLVVFNYGIGIFPKEDSAEEALLTFLNKHRDIKAIFSSSQNENEKHKRNCTGGRK